MTPAEHTALHRARTLIRELHAECNALTERAPFLARFTLVLAVAVEVEGPAEMIVETCGNATKRLTQRMLDKALLQHHVLRKNVEAPEVVPLGNIRDLLATVRSGSEGCSRCGAAAGEPCDPAKHDEHGGGL